MNYKMINEIKEYAIIQNVPIMQDEGIDFLTTFIVNKNIKSILEVYWITKREGDLLVNTVRAV